MRLNHVRRTLLGLATLLLAAPLAWAQPAPAVIRIGSPELGTGKGFPGGNPLAVVRANQ